MTVPTGLIWTGIDEETYNKLCSYTIARSLECVEWEYPECAPGDPYCFPICKKWEVVAHGCTQPFFFKEGAPSSQECGPSLEIKSDSSYIRFGTFCTDDWKFVHWAEIYYVGEENGNLIFQIGIPWSSGYINLGQVIVHKNNLTDWIVIRLLQYYATVFSDKAEAGTAKTILSFLGRDTSYPKSEIEPYCPSEFPQEVVDIWNRIKQYYEEMVKAANNAQKVVNDWNSYGCQECKAKLAYSEYDYNLCVKEWNQKLAGYVQEYNMYKNNRDGEIGLVKQNPINYDCFLKAHPEYEQYLTDPPIETSLPDCSMPLPKLRNVSITSEDISFEYYAPVEMNVLVELSREENGKLVEVDSYELTFKPEWQKFSKEMHLSAGVYYLSFPNLSDYVNPIVKVVKECQEGQTKCEGYDLYKCQNGKWVLVERNSTQCGAPCTAGCETACQTACEQSCQTACELSCQQSCELSSQVCTTACETACQSTCELVCEQACETACQQTCEQSCQQSCELSSQACTTACEQSCQTTCETTSQAPAQNIVEMVANLLNISEEEAKRLLIGIGALIGIVFVVSLLRS